jgi:hypothetical protein
MREGRSHGRIDAVERTRIYLQAQRRGPLASAGARSPIEVSQRAERLVRGVFAGADVCSALERFGSRSDGPLIRIVMQ